MDVQLDKDKRVESENTKAQEETVREDVEKFEPIDFCHEASVLSKH